MRKIVYPLYYELEKVHKGIKLNPVFALKIYSGITGKPVGVDRYIHYLNCSCSLTSV